MKLLWYKWRQHTSSSVSEWRYISVNADMNYMPKKEWIEEMLDRNNFLDKWSEHYRRVEIRKVKTIPVKDLKEKINDIKDTITNLSNELKDLDSELRFLEFLKAGSRTES